MSNGTCDVQGCLNPVLVVIHGLCRKHYTRWQRYGHTNAEADLPKECPGCLTTFTPTRTDQKSCSPACARRTSMRKARGMVAVIPRRRECGYCETEFESTDGRRFYCGEACADTANRLSEIGLKYGMTLKEHRTLWVAQGGVCAICQGSESRVGVELLAIDHCHTTGKVRGLLCSNCNRALGLLKDSPGVLRAAAEYLAAHQQ